MQVALRPAARLLVLADWLVASIYVASYIALIMALLFNFHISGVPVMLAGTLMNFLAIIANGGRMPVSESALLGAGLEDQVERLRSGALATHTLVEEGTRLTFLADIYHVRAPYLPPGCFSLGDGLMAIGVFAAFYLGMTRLSRQQRRGGLPGALLRSGRRKRGRPADWRGGRRGARR
jgi:hypothetical protein